MQAQDHWKAFVLMPFDPEFQSVYEELIRPALEQVGYEVTRADSLLDQQNILADIVRGIASSDLIVADLTTRNENVLYELGLSHGLKRPTVLLAQSMDDVPFDLRSYRIQLYSTHFAKVGEFKAGLQKIASEHKGGRVRFGNPITEFHPREPAPTAETPRGAMAEGPSEQTLKVPSEETGKRTQAEVVEEPEEEKGFLDFIIEAQEAGRQIAEILEEFTHGTAAVGKRMGEHSAEIQRLGESPGRGTAAQVHKVALIASTDMTAYSENIEANLPTLDRNVDVLAESYLGYADWVAAESEHHREQLEEFCETITRLLTGTRAALGSTRSYRATTADLGRQRISRAVNRASQRLTQALDGVISVMEKVEALCVRILYVADEKLRN